MIGENTEQNRDNRAVNYVKSFNELLIFNDLTRVN